jgi:diguanylate cyclase (GGDEF)-like protein
MKAPDMTDNPVMQPRRRLSGAAYWTMLKRVVVIAGGINVGWVVLYAALGSLPLVLVSVVSVALYAASRWLLEQRRNTLASALIWIEAVGHTVIGSLLLGWDSGFHYFLMMLAVPILVIGTPPRRALPLACAVLVAYAALYALCTWLGPLRPLPPLQTGIAMWVNIVLVFGMFYAVAAYYRVRVVDAERQLLQMATVDPLTGLANRTQFQTRAAAELSRMKRSGEPITLMLADVDFFKRINDEFGHDAGDKVLVRLATLLREGLRDCDVLARWGGEEFLALLPACDSQGAYEVAERLRQAVAAVHIEIGGRALNVTMSFGIAEVDGDQDLLAATTRADRALYRSKHEGRNRVTVNTELEAAARQRADRATAPLTDED